MSAPVPAPRSIQNGEQKKPVPTPRKSIAIVNSTPSPTMDNNNSKKDSCSKTIEPNIIAIVNNASSPTMDNNSSKKEKTIETNFNTFTRRVRTLSNTSKQLTEGIAGRVQEKKKAVIEGTRQSVRRITRRFTTAGCEQAVSQIEAAEDTKSEPASDIFNSLRFQSPLKLNEHVNIYNNINVESDNNSTTGSEESSSLPPPLHPPPPLRENSIYDQPHSLVSSSSNSNSSGNLSLFSRNQYEYESVFPSYPYNSDTESCVDMTAGTIDRKVDLLRSESWNYYDPVCKTENIYNNVDSTPVLMTSMNKVGVETKQNIPNVENAVVSHLERRNSLYENHSIVPPPRLKRASKRAAESVIIQFDPLNETASTPTNYSEINDLRALEELLQGDLYGNISNAGTYDNWSTSNDSEIEEFASPPTPPARVDSLPEDATTSAAVICEKSKTSWFTVETNPKSGDGVGTGILTEPKKINWLKHVNDVLKKAPDLVKSNKQKDHMTPRPSLSPRGVAQQKGMLYKVTNGPVEDLFGEFSGRWCILETGNFICFSDTTSDNIKENFAMENILSIQMLSDQKFKYRYENDDLHCFEVNVTGKGRGGHVYGSRSISERRIWMQRIAESLTDRFKVRITSEYSRIGWAYVKEGVSGEWIGAWIVLSKRNLSYATDKFPVKTVDLRKARCIVLHAFQDNEDNPCTADKGPNMLVDCHNGVLYLRMWTSRESKAWCHIVRLAAHNNGPLIEEQQLTKNDVPVIVEKSINFIYAHGSMSEGIYRRAGSGTTVLDMLAQFRKDAWSMQLTTDKYTEHDVATALKRFFRDLPESLLINNNRQYLHQVSLVKNTDEKVRMFRAVFDHFTPIAYKTARRLLGHLHFISTQSQRNLMSVDNLAAVWGPTLLHCEDTGQYAQKESAILAQLISLYHNIFPENPEEAEQERMMLQVLEKCTRSPQGPVNTKSSGDLRIWVYLHNKEGQTFNVAVGPQKTAYEVCLELSTKIKLPVHELQLEELVLNDNLTRPVHHKEKVLDVVLRWGYWDDMDRKDNCLVLSSISKYWEYIQQKLQPVSGELKFADNKSKSFKQYMFEFTQAKLTYYKDRTCLSKLASWNIEDILWYIGHEPKRNPQSKWTLTFIIKKLPPNRTKSCPWFGNIISWNDPALRATWLGTMMRAEHQKDLTPPAQHVNLMSN